METNRQKKMGALFEEEIIYILQRKVPKNWFSKLILSVTKVTVTTDLSVAKVYLSIFPTEKGAELLKAIQSNAPLIKHDLAQRVKNQLRKVPNLMFYVDDSLDYIEKIDDALKAEENPIDNRDLLARRKKK